MVAYAGFWWRVLAYIIDAVVLNIAMSFIGSMLGLGLGFGDLAGPGFDESTFWALYSTTMLISLVGSWLYFALMESSSLQATLGKLVVGVVVTDLNGQRISFLRATGRYFAKILSGAILLIGFIMVAFTERKQGLHDLIASTLVYKTRDPKQVVSHSTVFE